MLQRLTPVLVLACIALSCDHDKPHSAPSATATPPNPAANSSTTAPSVPSSTPSAAPKPARIEIAALELESDHCFALLSNGEVLGWGSNALGVLSLDKKVENQTTPVALSAIPRLKQLTTGKWHACGVTLEDKAVCWGRDFGGALGDGTAKEDRNAPPSPVVDLNQVSEIQAGGSHTCARSLDGKTSCWGVVVAGAVIRPQPVAKVAALASLSLGGDATCGLTPEGGVWCWDLVIGKDFDYGHAIEGESGNIEPPRAVAGLSGLKKLVVSGTHACALMLDGALSCWGFGEQGELGTGRSGDGYRLLSPMKVKDLGKASDVAVGEGFSCAVLEGGTVMCWGLNDWGQLGTGDTKMAAAPKLVRGVTDARLIAAGGSHVCAATQSGSIYCWGKNLSGQVGDGTSGFKATKKEAVLVRKL